MVSRYRIDNRLCVFNFEEVLKQFGISFGKNNFGELIGKFELTPGRSEACYQKTMRTIPCLSKTL